MSAASHAQRQAASPEHSCWVEASAGTGKTKVLTDRVLNLLITGASCEHILCLTFTKAASSEMANRIQEKLAAWAAMEDDALQEALKSLLGRPPTTGEQTRTKSLFATVIDTPGGMKIQTIHAFCQMVLKKFPLEAGLAPHFTVMSDGKNQELLKCAFEKALLRLPPGHVQCLTHHGSPKQLFELLESLMGKRRQFMTMIQQNPTLESFIQKVYTHLKIPFPLKGSEILERSLQSPFLDHRLFEEGTAKDQVIGLFLKEWNEKKPKERVKDFENYVKLFLTTTRTIRKNFISTSLARQEPELHPLFLEEAHRLLDLMEHYHHALVAEASISLITFAKKVFETYQSLKTTEALLDYDDLIHHTADLFQKPDIAPWILYKLDGGIQHVLVDEAQDTNEDQWHVIAAIAAEFFSEEPDPDNPRTLFVVGDMKQSIYSFQGASPLAFQAVKRFFAKTSKEANHSWMDINLTTSFRSTEPVLTLVDHVFQNTPKLSPEGLELPYVPHQAHRKNHGGHVELWPLVEPQEKETRAFWEIPDRQKQSTSPRKILAQRIAKTIQEWIESKKILPSKGRPIRPSDIMILVRRRDHFVESLVRALKNANIPVTGIDRLVLTDHIAIQDLLVLGDFLLLPEDDLALATILKSPLIGLNETDLFDLAHGRKNRSLWHTLKTKSQNHSPHKKVFDLLSDLMQKVDFSTPFELYHHILDILDGRKTIIARLGTEAEDVLEAFLNLCLDFEKETHGSFQGFLSWIREENTEIKRNLEQSDEDKIRIMTVHGSKGLQAPIVFLPDTTQTPLSRSTLFWQDTDPKNLLMFWCPKSKFKTDALKKLHPQFDEMAEYYRLLYVALTRAEDELYVGGWKPKNYRGDHSWYQAIQSSMEVLGKPTGELGTKQDTLIFHQAGKIGVSPSSEKRSTTPLFSLPEWLKNPVKPETPPSVITPSTMDMVEQNIPTIQTYSVSAATRGTLIHTALEWVMKTPKKPPWDLIQAFLQKSLTKTETNHILGTLQKTLALPSMQRYFNEGTLLTESNIQSFEQENNASIKGAIDFLWINDPTKSIDIIDYKTGHFSQEYAHTPPESYKEQMSLYKKTIESIYPAYHVQTFLLWTEVQKLIRLPI